LATTIDHCEELHAGNNGGGSSKESDLMVAVVVGSLGCRRNQNLRCHRKTRHRKITCDRKCI